MKRKIFGIALIAFAVLVSTHSAHAQSIYYGPQFPQFMVNGNPTVLRRGMTPQQMLPVQFNEARGAYYAPLQYNAARGMYYNPMVYNQARGMYFNPQAR